MSTNSNNLNDRQDDGSEKDNKGDYKLVIDEVIDSENDQYKVMKFLGRGTFGQVVKCWKNGTEKYVAVKILKNEPNFAKQGKIEINTLMELNKDNPDKFNFVRTYESFLHKNHTCIVFELLRKSLFDYLKKQSLNIGEIRAILKQLLIGLVKLKQLGIIHTDLKPENIMLVDPMSQPCRVKIIDFGSAIHINKAVPNDYLQTRYYRSPEIILGLPFCEAIDMWSLGCVAAELLLRSPLYPGLCEFDQIRFIMHTQGPLPQSMLSIAPNAITFFNNWSSLPKWQLKDPDQYQLETRIKPKDTRRYKFSCLDAIGQVNVSEDLVGDELLLEKIYRRRFVELLKKMLQLDQNRRIIPCDALKHIFMRSAGYDKEKNDVDSAQVTEDNSNNH